MSEDPRRQSWRAPEARDAPASNGGVRGALGGSRLFEQPQYRAEAEAFLAFAAAPGRLAVEVGFDHGDRLLDLAARDPRTRWVGLEVREARVLALAPRCPPNCRVWRADARTVFRVLMPAGRVDRVDVLFPTPWWDEGKRDRRLLLTAEFLKDLERTLLPDGCVHIATDVEGYFAHVASLFAGWQPAPPPEPHAEVLSRRERVCQRDGLSVYRATFRRPDGIR